MDHKQAKKYRQQIMFNNEDDVHFPTLTVNRTMKFALRNKVPRERPEHLHNRKDYVQEKRDGILESLGIPHTKKTLVGNEFIRGVSGGERKRVSLAEVMAGQVSILSPYDINILLTTEIRVLFNFGITQLAVWIPKQRLNSPACCDARPTRIKRR